MAKTYVRSIKFSQSGETYWIRDAETKEKVDALETTVAGKAEASAVYTKSETDELLNAKQTTLIAGDNITIEDNVISATGGGSGTTNYNNLTNKPLINDVELSGNKSLDDLGIAAAADLADKQDVISDLEDIRSGAAAGATAVQPAAISDMLTKTEAGTTYATKSELDDKQDVLVSGTNIKTINNQTLLGEGNIVIQGGSGTSDYEQLQNLPKINDVTLTGNKSASDLGLLTSNQGAENTNKLLYTDDEGDVTFCEPDNKTIYIDDVTVTGKNLLNPDDENFTYDYYINANGQQLPSSSSTAGYGTCGYISVKAGETYTYSSDFRLYNGNVRIHAFDSNKQWIKQVVAATTGSWTGSLTFDAPENCCFIRCTTSIHKSYAADIPATWYQFEKGSLATTYEAYYERQATQIKSDIGNIREIAESASTTANEAKTIAQQALSNSAPISKIVNPKCRMDKDTFRVLDIGNSFTEDCVYYMANLINYLKANKGLDDSHISYSFAYRGGASYKNWFDIFHDKDTSSYTITQKFGGVTETFSGTAAAGNGDKFRKCLKDHHFDLIIIHQVSTYSGESDDWEGKTAAGYLKEFIQLLRFYQPQAHIGFLMVHASPRQMASGETTTREQWGRIAKSTEWIAQNYGIDFVVPAGTAVENLRISKYGHIDQDPTKGFVPGQLTRDDHHMADGLCRYTGTCAYYEAVFAPYFGISMYNSGWVYQPVTGRAGDTIQIDTVNAQAAQMSAMLACSDKYTLNNPDGLFIGPESDVPVPPQPVPPSPDPELYDEIPLSTANVLPGYWKLNSAVTTGSIIDIVSGYPTLIANHSTNPYIALPQTDVGSILILPAGYTMRPNYINTTTNKGIRASTEFVGPLSFDTLSDHGISAATFNELNPDKVLLHFYKTSDSGKGGAYVDTTYITENIVDFSLWQLKTPENYTQLSLSAPTNMEQGWYGWWPNSGSAIDAQPGFHDISTGRISEHDGVNAAYNNNGSDQTFFRPKSDVIIPLDSLIKLPTGFSARCNWYDENVGWYRDANLIVGNGTYQSVDIASRVPSETRTYSRVYLNIYKVSDAGSTGAREMVTDSYINAKIAEGVEIWVKNANE